MKDINIAIEHGLSAAFDETAPAISHVIIQQQQDLGCPKLQAEKMRQQQAQQPQL